MSVAALPWKEILRGATLAASLARGLFKHQSAKPRQVSDDRPDPQARLQELTQRLEATEAAAQEQAKVINLLAEEVQSLARRALVGYRIGAAGLIVAVVAVAVALLR
jgi:hypothetical protein